MIDNKNKIFYSFITRDGYKGSEPAFYSLNDFEWVKQLENSFEDIKGELNNLIENNVETQPYFDKNIVSRENSWRTIPLMAWGVNFRKNSSRVPKTMLALKNIPGFVSASFNLLESGAEILPHYGDTDAIVRCHLGIKVSDGLPNLGFEVNGEQKAWEESKVFIFSDAHYHTAWNKSSEDRVILLFDVFLPKYINKKRRVSARVLSSLYLQSISQKFKMIQKLPKWLQMILYWFGAIFAYLLTPIRNALSYLFNRKS